MKKIYKVIMIILVLFIFITRILIPQLSKNTQCITTKDFLETYLNGVVIKKYIDYSEHSFSIIEIKDLNKFTIKKLNLTLETTYFFYRITINDTLHKEIGSMEISVKKNKGKVVLEKIDFGCKN